MHAYTYAGEARHYQPTKSKKAKKAFRPTGLKDIIAQTLLPSVSDITKVISAPGLERYKLLQVAEQAFYRPPIADEPFDSWSKFISTKAEDDANQAKELGNAIHHALENYYTGKQWDNAYSGYVYPTIDAIASLGIKTTVAEVVLTNPEWGYAGTTDLPFTKNGAVGILDFKSRRTKPGEVVKPIETHPVQVAAYHMAAYGEIDPTALGYNVYISTTEVGRVEVVEYDAAALRTSWEAFTHMLALWRWRTGYDPRVVVPVKQEAAA